MITLGVSDLTRAKEFYAALGWHPSADSPPEIAFFQAGGMVFSLWDRALLAEDSAVSDGGGSGGVTLAHNVRSPGPKLMPSSKKPERAELKSAVSAAGTDWGGYSGAFVDPDGHSWEVAHNPGWTIGSDGSGRPGSSPLTSPTTSRRNPVIGRNARRTRCSGGAGAGDNVDPATLLVQQGRGQRCCWIGESSSGARSAMLRNLPPAPDPEKSAGQWGRFGVLGGARDNLRTISRALNSIRVHLMLLRPGTQQPQVGTEAARTTPERHRGGSFPGRNSIGAATMLQIVRCDDGLPACCFRAW